MRARARVVDGAMGTELLARGAVLGDCLEALCVTAPDRVRAVHEDYLAAGAEVLETCSFGANRARLATYGRDDVRALNLAAAALAREVAGDRAYVAGSIGPTCLGPQDVARARDAFREQAELLVEANVDAVFVETMRAGAELSIAVTEARAAIDARPLQNKPVLVALLSVGRSGILSDGAPMIDAARRALDLGADVIGAGCCDDTASLLPAIEAMLALGAPVAAMPSAEGTIDDFVRLSKRLVALGASLVGGCCGTTPAHTRAFSSTF
jgi:homocysteine S-methyltransferase